jgi:hypothetical protein
MIHLPNGGSTAERKLNCPGWTTAASGVPPKPSSQAAIDGSMHHMVQERCRLEDVDPATVLKWRICYREDKVSREFVEDDLLLSQLAFDATDRVLDEHDVDEFLVEPFVQLIPGDTGGSTDMLGLSSDRRTLVSLDYKFGRGVVNVENNAQLMFYPMCARHDPTTKHLFDKVEHIVLVIIQPQRKGVCFQHVINITELDAFEVKYRAALESDEIKAGSHCKWCPAEPYCPAKRARVAGTNLLGREALDGLQDSADMLAETENWVNAMKAELYLQLNRGVPVVGWKIVEKKAAKKWTDAATAATYLKSKHVAAKHITNPAALRTPTQVLAALKQMKKCVDIEAFFETKSSGTTLAQEDDSREAVITSDIPDNLAALVKK